MVTDELALQRFITVGRLSACLLHEISTPLTAALLNLEVGQRPSRGVRQARRNLRLLHRYVVAARQQVHGHSESRPFWVQPQINQLQPLLLPLARQYAVRLRLEPMPQCRLYGDPVKFQQVVSNVVINAIEAAADAAVRSVRISGHIVSHTLVIHIQDQSGGIDPVIMTHIFDEFVSTKVSSNLGLGLAMVKRYTQELGGTVTVSPVVNGTRFTLRLPLSKI